MGDGDGASAPPASAGWGSDFATFRGADPADVLRRLRAFVPDPGEAQARAWHADVPALQREVGEVVDARADAAAFSAVLEHGLALDSRRTDAVFLVAGPVLVLELKGKTQPTQGDLDQVAAYARDLRAYHRDCHERVVHPVLVPTASKDPPVERDGVWVCGPAALDALVLRLASPVGTSSASLDSFLDPDAYCPLPTLVQAARELVEGRRVRSVWRAHACTDPAVRRVAAVAEEAARTRTRRLVLVTGVPGSGKTLVGLRAVHSSALDAIAVRRDRPPAVFLSGNKPLVQVLQYALRGAGGGGRTFVRHVKDWLDRHVPRPALRPDEHVVVFDEAQRAFSREKVAELHAKWAPGLARSEPAHFVELAERTEGWAVLVGLIGSGQEIHVGEEGGIAAWREALERSPSPEAWTVHAPADLEPVFAGGRFATAWDPALHLDTSIRFHLAADLHRFVERVVGPSTAEAGREVAERLWRPYGTGVEGVRLWATRDLARAKAYLRERYADRPEARYGLLASSRDRSLPTHGVPNDWASARAVRVGPWFVDGDESPHSCRHLWSCVTEFDAQGLELDMALVAWGTDFRRVLGRWSDADARGYRRGGVRPVDPHRLRTNAYRVLLTRGRDGTVLFVPAEPALDETWHFLLASGFRELT
jgi:hypothetical protein